MPLNNDDVAAYQRDGYVLVRDLLPPGLVRQLLVGIDQLICAKTPGLVPSQPELVSSEIHAKIAALAERDRPLLGKVYDAIRKLAPFWSMVGSQELLGSIGQLTGSTQIGVVFRGCGIRLDLPNEDRWRSLWHQEYHSQVSSLNGITAWFNLVPVSVEMGPVELLTGSHREGLLPVRAHDPLNQRRDYTQTFTFPNEAELTARFPHARFETRPGDVLFLNFLTVHQSGFNRSAGLSRVTCQVRYCDMSHPDAIQRNWSGGWQEGGDFTQLHPEAVLP